LVPVNALAENRIAKWSAARRSNKRGGNGIPTISSHGAFKIAANKNDRQNRCACHRR
jgi:hypothetical protein